jgi:MFS transporter, PAT family, solute carrier family 33 (acetyl-CoA transportor), member 1
MSYRSQLLNTFTNLGGTWPKYFVLKGKANHSLGHCLCLIMGGIAVDFFSIATCEVSEAGSSLTVRGERSGHAFN